MRDWGAKHLIAAVLMLAIGLVVGGLGPRAEVRSLRKQLAELEERPCERATGSQIASVFGGRPWQPRPDRPAFQDEPEAPDEARQPATEGGQVKIELGDDAAGSAGDDLENIEMLKDALALRRSQAMAALREQARATDEQMDTVDSIVDDMNADLKALAEEFVETVKDGQEPSRRDLMTFAADTLDVLIETEDALYGALPPEQREQLTDEVLDPTSYVDSSVVDILSTLDQR